MESQTTPQKILIVEDDPDIGRIAQMILEKLHYSVRLANCARKAQEIIAAETPHLIICDVMMPEMDGLQLLTILKADSSTATIPVMMMSALTQDSDVRRGEVGGAEYYLKKPFSSKQLIAAVNGVLATVSVRQHLLARP